MCGISRPGPVGGVVEVQRSRASRTQLSGQDAWLGDAGMIAAITADSDRESGAVTFNLIQRK